MRRPLPRTDWRSIESMDVACRSAGQDQVPNGRDALGRTALLALIACRYGLDVAILAEVRPHAVLTPAYRLVFRLEIANRPGMFAQVATTVGQRGCSLGAIDLVEATPDVHVRDVTVD